MADIFPESREEEILVSMIDGEEYNKAPESRIEALLLELKEVIEEGGGGGGTTNYNLLMNKPSINGVTLTGDKSLADLGITEEIADQILSALDGVTINDGNITASGEVIDGQGNTLSVLAEALTKTASGNPVVISDCAGGKARLLKTTIEAIQDLHGYDHPWAGGAYKNKLPMTLSDIKAANTTGTWSGNVYTINGGTITVLTDDADNVTGIKVNGTFSANSDFNLTPKADYSALNGQILSSGGVVCSTSTYTLYCALRISPWTAYAYLNNVDAVTISSVPQSNDVAFFLRVFSGTVNNVTFKPMVSSSATDSFAPYSNICPISGRTEARVDTENEDSSESAYAVIQLGQTVYGADVNWDTGVLTITWVKYTLSSTGQTWIVSLSEQTIYANFPDLSAVETDRNQIKCSHFKTDLEHQAIGTDTNYAVYLSASKNLRVNYRPNGGSVDKDTITDFFDAQITAGTPVEICGILATPQTIQLTPTQLQMLKGYNRVTIESGTITLDYVAKAISGNDEEIAPLVGDKATKSYSVNDFIERADGLYRVTAPIASGASFTANNTVKMSIGEALTYLYNK